MIDSDHEVLSITRQCALLGLSRSSCYYQRMEVSAEDLKLMRLMDELHLRLPFYGSRRLAWSLQQKGYAVGRKRVQRLMRQMGIEAIYPRPPASNFI